MFRQALRLLAVATACIVPAAVQAQAGYPDKPIRIVVPYPTGGFNDTLGRLVGAKLTEAWGQPAIVDNKPGAGTMIGTGLVAKAPADGYTLLVVQFPFAANPSLYKKLPYDTTTAFAPVVLAGRSPMLLVVNADSKVRTVADLLKEARAKPASVNYGTSGSGSSNHLAMELFEAMAKVSMTQVPYKGSTPLLTDLAGGQVDAAFDAFPHVLPFIQSGRVRPLAVATATRSELMPDLPTVSEAGVPGYEVSSWHGFVVPVGTPPALVDKLNKQINAILKMESVRKVFHDQGVVPDGGTPAEFSGFITAQMGTWKKVVEDAGLPPQ